MLAFTGADKGSGGPMRPPRDGPGRWPPGSLLAGLPDATRQRLLRLGVLRYYPEPGKVLISEGDTSRVTYLLLSGSVKVTGSTDQGEALLAIRVGGDVVGELAALDGQPRLATVTTASPVRAQVIGQPEFTAAVSRDPELALAIGAVVVDKLRSATSRRVDFTGCDATTRFSRVLLDLATRYGQATPTGQVITCPMTQAEFATLAGTAESTVQRTLRQLKADGVVATGYRGTTVLDMEALRKRSFPAHH